MNFGQSSGYSAYGQQPQNAWSQPQQQQNFSTFNTANRSVSQAPTYGQQQTPAPTQQADGMKAFFSTGDFDQTLTSFGPPFNFQDEKDGTGTARHHNIRVTSKYVNVSSQMQKVLDMQAMQKNGPQPNYEHLAGAEYQQNKQNYVHNAKVSGQPQQQQNPGYGQMGMQQNQGGWPSTGGMQQQNSSFQQKPLFGGTTGFGQQQQPQTSTFFGGGQQQQPQSTLFGGQQQQTANQSPFGAKPAFGNAPAFGTQQPAFGQQTTTPAFGQQQTQQPTLFGGAKPTTFGQPTQQPQGMFGQTQPFGSTPAQPLGTFGQQPAQGSLFGQQGAQPTMALGASGQNTGLGLGLTSTAQGGSLFGAKTPAPAGGSLFGGQAGATNPGQGMFGAPQQAQTTPGTGLFGAQPAGGSLFGAKPLGQQTTTPLFGGQTQQQPTNTFGGGLGGQGGMFGNLGQGQQQQQQQQSFSLFGAQQQNQNQAPQGPQQPQQPVYNPYGDPRSDPYGGASNYISSVSPLADAEQEIKKIQEDIFQSKSSNILRNDPFKDVTPLDKVRLGFTAGETIGYLDQYDVLPNIPTNEEKQESQQDKLSQKYKNAFQNESVIGQHKQIKVYNAQGSSFKQGPPIFGQSAYGQPNLRAQKSFGTDTSLQYSRQSSLRSNAQNVNYDNQQEQDYSQVSRSNNPDVLQITCQIQATKDSKSAEIPSSVYSLQIHKSRHMKDIYDKLRKYLREGQRYSDLEDFKLVYRGQLLSDKNSLAQSGIQESATIDVLLQMKVNPETPVVTSSFNAAPSQVQASNRVESKPVSNSLKAPKRGYQTSPSFDSLKKLSEQELRHVKDFKIWNEHGEIHFRGETDLTETDLAEIVEIVPMAIEVYPDFMKEQNRYPSLGQKLNRPAEMTFRKIAVKGETLVQKVEKLKRMAQTNDFHHISFNEKTCDWVVAVAHFTKYTIAMDDEEDTQQMEQDSFQGAAGNMRIPEEDSQMSEYSLNGEIAKFRGAQQQPRPQLPGTAAAPLTTKGVPLQSNAQSTAFTQYQQISTLQGLPIPRRRQDQQNESEVQSSIVRGDYGENEPMYQIQTGDKQIGLVQSQMLSQTQQNKFKAQEIIMKIAKRDNEIKNIGKLYGKKKTVQECLTYLKEKQQVEVKTLDNKISGFKKTPLKVQRFRAQFTPNGNLLTLKRSTNQLVISEVKIVSDSTNEKQRSVYQKLTEVLKKHTSFSEVSNEEIAKSMREMRIDSRSQQQNDSQTDFDDKSIQNMLAKSKLPYAQIKQTPCDMFKLYEDLAQTLVLQIQHTKDLSQMTRDKLNQEFYIICLLNALFGNPNIHLVQIHPAFRQGPNNYQKVRARYADNFTAGTSLATEKKRKNALTEVLRFICHQEFPVTQAPFNPKDDVALYNRALAYLMNGDVKGAVDFLNKMDKKQMAMKVINCFNNQIAQQCMNNFTKEQMKGYSAGAQLMIRFITGQYFNAEHSWLQALLYHLMVKTRPEQTLQEALKEFNTEIYSKQFEMRSPLKPLSWVLIKFYALSRADGSLINNLKTFSSIQVYPNSTLQDDHHLSFLVSLSLHNFLVHHDQVKHLYNGQYDSMLICHESLKNAVMHYIGQLIRERDWQQALLITSYIPPTYTKLRKQVVYGIVMRNSAYMLKELTEKDKENKMQQFLFKQIKIPQVYMTSARAILHHSLGNYESALQDYHDSGNDTMAHQLFMHHIAPLYFTTDLPSLLKSSPAYNQSLTDLLRAFNLNSANIVDWQTQGNVLLHFTNSLFKVKNGGGQLFSEWPELTDMQLNALSRELFRDQRVRAIHLFIWENMVKGECHRRKQQGEEAARHGNMREAGGYLEAEDSWMGRYLENPILARYYQELAQSVSTWQYCTEYQGEIAGDMESMVIEEDEQ